MIQRSVTGPVRLALLATESFADAMLRLGLLAELPEFGSHEDRTSSSAASSSSSYSLVFRDDDLSSSSILAEEILKPPWTVGGRDRPELTSSRMSATVSSLLAPFIFLRSISTSFSSLTIHVSGYVHSL